MKTISAVLLFILIACNSYGQQLEWEILNMGYSFGLAKDENGNTWSHDGVSGSLSFGSELRIKLLDNRLSPGLQFSFTPWNRYTPDGSSVCHQSALSYMALCDYNFLNVHSKIIPFAGVGIGISRVEYSDETISGPPTGTLSHLAFSPRVGIEYKRIRLALDYKYLGNRNNYFNFRVGFVIG